ncbi:ParA family protein [Paraburkholderia sp. MM5384-R2]|uniref:ParA family protein n=1 Tax=Paraburkholderia sp. MM5384-R2 TaxID=2723097 RepID=UPI00161D3633|nr:AAA family ATPase [Paraburkholderia sp. MM5384-R2]MBB5498735.1 chromosome partitioning protein [Paraburkholderia sp. MM5384-R2]
MTSTTRASDSSVVDEPPGAKHPQPDSGPFSISAPGDTTAEDLLLLANRSTVMLKKIRDEILKPEPRKVPPLVSSTRVQEMCGIDRKRMAYALNTTSLPQGSQTRPGGVRSFSVEEAIAWVKAELKPTPRRGRGKVITVANFKGGVTKTTTSTLLSQGLSMRRGRKVCHIDLDPQGSATTLYGYNPHAEINEEDTVIPLIQAYVDGTEFDMRTLPVKTYWPNLDLIPASPQLFNAEFMLPARANMAKEGDLRFEQVLHRGLESLTEEYDYIIIDTAPTLSYLTINAVFAANGVIVPVVPDMLSFASMVQFWHLFSDLITGMEEFGDTEKKRFEFVDVLVTRVAPNKAATRVLQQWIANLYGSRVIPVEIPETDLARNTNLHFQTIYDIDKYEGGLETLRRIRNPIDQFVDFVDEKASASWVIGGLA